MNKKVKTRIIKTTTVVAAFILSLTGAYFLTPNATKKGTFNIIDQGDASESTSHFSDLITRFTTDTGILDDEVSKERTYYGLSAEFDNFSLSFKKDDNSTLNTIGVDGNLDLFMKGLKNINFNLNADVDYNGRNLPLEIGYINNTVYFGLKDLRVKAGSTTIDELLGNEEEGVESLIYKYFMAAEEEGGINFDVIKFVDETYSKLIDGVIGGLDMSSLDTSALNFTAIEDDQEGIGFDVSEKQTSSGWDFDITVQIHNLDEETGDMNIKNIALKVSSDEDFRIKRIDLGTLEFGNFTIRGAINVQAIADLEVLAPDNEQASYYNANYNYVEVINYKGWLQKLANFLGDNNQKFGFDFALNLDSSSTEIGKIKGSINADFSKLIDLSDYKITRSLNHKKATLMDNVKDKAKLGIALDLFGQNNEEFANLAINYTDGAGYVTLNESLDDDGNTIQVLKSKLEAETINWMINELPGMFSSISNDSSSMDSLFSFVTDSTLVTSIKSGDYSPILDVINTLKNDNDKIEIGLDLSSLGLGDNASVDLVLDSRTGEDNKVLDVEINNIEIGSLSLDLSLNTTSYTEIEIGNEDDYDSLAFLPTVVDQVAGILDTKQAGFTLEGSLFDDKNLGLTISGQGQFDYGVKYGFGDLTINQYKYENKGIWYSHKIALDVDNRSSDYSANNAYFVYGDTSTDNNIRGKVTIQSVLDIVDVVKTFINDNGDDPRFTKFLEPIMKMMSMGEFSEIINSKNYFRLLKNDLVKSMKRDGDNLDLVIGGALFELDSDITIRVKLKDDKLDSLNLINLDISGKKLNLTIALKDFDENKVSNVDMSKSYIDFSAISLLLKFGINTTTNNYYHLTADVEIDFKIIKSLDLDLNLFNFKVDVSIVVHDEYVKIYGVIDDAKITSIAQDYTPLFTKSIKSEFTFETYSDDDVNKEDGVGGYFDFKTTKVVALSGTTIKHYRTTSKNLLDGNNILVYLLKDFLLMRDSIMDKIGTIDLSSSEEKEASEFTNALTDTGFKYTEANKLWELGLNLDAITGIDALKDLELKIYGSDYENLQKLVVNLNIYALVTLPIGATITLDNPDPSITDWPSATQNAFDAIKTNVSNSNFGSKLNDPNAYLSY